jgi:hypothetical protein
MSSTAKSKSASKVIAQLSAQSTSGSSRPAPAPALKSQDNHVSTTIIERISNARRAYLNWVAMQASSITGKEPKIDSEADASWKAR